MARETAIVGSHQTIEFSDEVAVYLGFGRHFAAIYTCIHTHIPHPYEQNIFSLLVKVA